jgi:hypothetical protein
VDDIDEVGDNDEDGVEEGLLAIGVKLISTNSGRIESIAENPLSKCGYRTFLV